MIKNRKKIILLFAIIIPFTGICQQDLKLWYNQPARTWTEALPIDNGRLGAMIFGRERDEIIQLNESTLWSGGPVSDNINPSAPKYLQEIREAVFAGDYAKAASLSKKMQGVYSESYLPLGDSLIKQNFKPAPSENYYRDLNIRDAVATTRFTVNRVTYTRQIFSSAPDQVMVVRVTADKPAQLNLTISTISPLRYQQSVVGNDVLSLNGKAPTHVDPNYTRYKREPVAYDDSVANCKGMRYVLSTKAINKGGKLQVDTSGISIQNANEVVLFVTAATSFNGFNKCRVSAGKDETAIVKNICMKQ